MVGAVQSRAVVVGLVIAGTAVPAVAQDAGSLLREMQRQQELQRQERLPAPGEIRPQQAPAAIPDRGERIIVKGVRFTGKVELLPQAEREQLVASVRGKRLGIKGLYALADQVTAVLQGRGRLLARALLPPQDITNGIVTIEIAEGALKTITLDRAKGVRVREDLLRAIIEGRLKPDGVTRQDLEDALLRMNDLPGVSVHAKLAPGDAPNTSKLVVGVAQAPILGGGIWADNYGSSNVGKAQGNGLISLTDVSGYGDLTRLSGTVSQGQEYGSLVTSVPLGASGFIANASYGYLDYHNIDAIGSALGLTGFAHFANGGVDYSLIRSRDFNLQLGGTVTWKALVDDSIVGTLQDKRSTSGTLSLNGDRRDALLGGGITNWSVSWTFGDLDLARVASALAVDQAGLRTQGPFNRINASVARLQALPDDFALFGRLYGQWADKNPRFLGRFCAGRPVRRARLSRRRGARRHGRARHAGASLQRAGACALRQPATRELPGRRLRQDQRVAERHRAGHCLRLQRLRARQRRPRRALDARVAERLGELGPYAGRQSRPFHHHRRQCRWRQGQRSVLAASWHSLLMFRGGTR